mmetsp:Transcript_57079/g.125196  ORF Transcript_57079/g.125196 Transcript_57079/m.125196 type:complete len:222 (+) Transcript_57079:926-1591(+)
MVGLSRDPPWVLTFTPLALTQSMAARLEISTWVVPHFLMKASAQSKMPPFGRPTGTTTSGALLGGPTALSSLSAWDKSDSILTLKGSAFQGSGPKLDTRTAPLKSICGKSVWPCSASGRGTGMEIRSPFLNSETLPDSPPKFNRTPTTSPSWNVALRFLRNNLTWSCELPRSTLPVSLKATQDLAPREPSTWPHSLVENPTRTCRPCLPPFMFHSSTLTSK